MGENNEAVPPAAPEVEQPQGSPTIPLTRFREVNDRMKAAEGENERLRRELAEARAARSKQPEAEVFHVEQREEEPKPRTPPAPINSNDRLERLELQVKLGLSDKAAELVSGYLRKGLDQDDALAMAKLKQPGAFGPDASGFQNGTHTAAPPGTGRNVVPTAQEPTRAERLASARGDLHRRSSMAIKFAADMVTGQMDRQLNKAK